MRQVGVKSEIECEAMAVLELDGVGGVDGLTCTGDAGPDAEEKGRTLLTVPLLKNIITVML